MIQGSRKNVLAKDILGVKNPGTLWRRGGNVRGVNGPSVALARRLARDGTARLVRTEAGLSIYDVARDVHVAPGTISRWETGKRTPRGEAAVRYAQLLGELLEVVSAR